MKKTFAILLCLALTLGAAPAALAVSLGKYQWDNLTLDCVEASGDSVFALEGMSPDEQAILLSFRVPDGLWASRGSVCALYGQLRLEGGDGTRYAARAAIRSSGEPVLSFLFAVPLDVTLESLVIAFHSDGAEGLPEGLAGDWVGTSGGISLRFTVNRDGSGTYVFEQAGYTESYDVLFSTEGAAFLVDIRKGDALGITRCEGTYAYADGVLTLDVRTTFANGRRFEYSIPCVRDVTGNYSALVGQWHGEDDALRYVFTFQADGSFSGAGYKIGETDSQAYSNQGIWQAVGSELWVTSGSQPIMKAAYVMTPEGLEITADDKTILFTKGE